MLDDVADALARHLLLVLPPTRPRDRADLERLPGPVAHLLGAVLDRRAAHEARLPASPWVDTEAEGVREAARQWREAAHAAARYPADVWEDALLHAAHQALRHLVRPVETAAAFCFSGEEGALPVATVRARLAAFAPYPYLLEVAEGYLDRKALDRVDRAGLERLLRRIDERMVAPFGPADWVALLAPLFALVRTVPAFGAGVPTPLLQAFFEAKGRADVADALAGPEAYDEAALDAALVDAPDAPLSEPRQPASTANGAPELGVADVRPWVAASARAGAVESESEPRGLASSPPAGHLPGAEPLDRLEVRALGPGALAHRDAFVAELAGGSEPAYRRLLETLAGAASWAEAWPALAAAFRESHVDIYGDAAIAFTDAAEARFATASNA